MRAMQMLDDREYGRQKLFRHSGWHNDRPMGSFPKFVYITNMKYEKYELQVKKVQRFLIRYGDLMVEKGVLAK